MISHQYEKIDKVGIGRDEGCGGMVSMNDLDFLSPFMWPLAADGHIGTFHLVPKLNTHTFIYASFLW